MTTFFIISVAIVLLLGIALLWRTDFFRSDLNDDSVIVLIVFFFALVVCGILVPLLKDYKTDYIELTNYKILKNEHSLVLDLSESSEAINNLSLRYSSAKIFRDHELVETPTDSIKFFLEKQKSFYGLTMSTQIVWSKYPFNTYHREE